VDDFALTPAEQALFQALNRRLDRLDMVLTAHGLGAFDVEYAHAVERDIEGVRLRVLPPNRVIASQRATMRDKDIAQLAALEATRLARASASRCPLPGADDFSDALGRRAV
jgi:hypothetical protein